MYTKAEGEKKSAVSSFCSISENNSHNPVSIWAHLHPVISSIKTDYPQTKRVHFFSDGPATQYRQKLNFHFICTTTCEGYNCDRITWNIFEAGHGDGVGGYIKRIADGKVATDSDICDASTSYHTVQGSSKIRSYLLTEDDIQRVEETVPKTNSSSSSSNDEPLSNFIASISNVEDRKLIDKENMHPSRISEGFAKSEVDEEGDVKIMFYKTVDDTGQRFKQVETDISYEPYDNILEIVSNPKTIEKRKRIYFTILTNR
ncbi:hypothetical protein HHI36_018124 [Cryptolaemus montrouzieri]|uniref:Uncharacterized protein n=1 Tax=Cryptolaemus montrouzieri TaxID=559131 RepID=A0ABD2NZ41_9CUCU